MPTEPQKKSLFIRAVRAIVSLGFTALFVGAAAIAVVVGAGVLGERAAATETSQVAPAIPISAKVIEIEDGYDVRRSYVGQIEAPKTVDLSFELGGRLDKIYVDEGDAVRSNQVLAKLDTDLLIADRDRLLATRDAVTAQLDFAQLTVERNEALRDRGFASQERLDQALSTQRELIARIREIDADLAQIEIRLEKSVLHAPADGLITRAEVDGGETLGSGQVILGLVQDGAPHVRVGLPLDIARSDIQQIQIKVSGQTYQATLETIRPDIDPVTRTRTALFQLEADAPLTLGQTASIFVTSRIEEPGAWVPVRSLKEGARGTWSLQVVDAKDVVRAAMVEVIYTESEHAYIRGTFPPGTRIVEQGPQRVTSGQKVHIIGGGV